MPRSRITTQFAFEEHNASVLQRVNRGVSQFSRFVFSPAGAVAGAAALAAGVAKITSSYLENADALQKMSLRTGLGTEELGALKFAFEQADLSADDLQRTVSRLNDRGLSLDDFADQIASISDISERTSLAVDVLGERLGPRLLSVLDQGSDGLDRYRREHERLGLAIDQQSAEAAARFNDNIDTIQRVVEGAGNRIGRAIVNWSGPILESAGQAFGILPRSAEEETQATIDQFINRLADALSTGESLGEALTDPVIRRLAEMARQAGVQTAAALDAANREIARRSAQATSQAYSERYLDIQQDILLGSGQAIRGHRNLPVPPGSEADFQPIEYDYDFLAGGGRREPFERSGQRTYSNRRFALYGSSGTANLAIGTGGIPAFAEADPASAALIRAFAENANFAFNPLANKEGAILQTEAIRANQVIIESPSGEGGGGFGGGRIDGQGLIDASKDDPVRVTIAGVGGLNEGANQNRRFREIRVDGDDLINRDGLIGLILDVIADYNA